MSGNKIPLVSILSSSFNHEKYVKYFIDSVLAQTNPNWELVIVDDCSSDNNVAEIKKYSDPRIKLIQQPFNMGINCASMRSFKEATGKYIVQCASDDMLAPNFIQTVVDYMEKHPEIGIFYPGLQYIDVNNNLIINKKDKSFSATRYEILKKLFYSENCLTSPGQVIRSSAFAAIQPLDIAISQHQDYKVHIQLLLENDCYISNEKIVLYRQPSQASGISYSTPISQCRCNLEEGLVMDAFLKIDSFETLSKIFGDDLDQFGPELKQHFNTIRPFILGKLALKADNEFKKIWGYNQIAKFINTQENYNLVHKLYNFCYRDFLNLAKEFVENDTGYKLKKKIKKYKKLFKVAFIINILLTVFLIYLFLT